MPLYCPVKPIAVPPPSEMPAVVKTLPNAISTARGGAGASISYTEPEPKKGRMTKTEAAAETRRAIDEQLAALREQRATRAKVMKYFEKRIAELAD